MTVSQTVLYIDGQNFLARLRGILRRRGVTEVDLTQFDFWGFLNRIFRSERVDLAQVYFAKLRAHKDTAEKSKELLEREEKLRAVFEGQGFHYITAGSVRARRRGDEITFEEKGVDIRLAVDLVKDVIDGRVSTVLLMSSDSDLQPAIHEARTRGAKVWYVGFQSRVNRGLVLTTDRSILITNDDVEAFYKARRTEDTCLPARQGGQRTETSQPVAAKRPAAQPSAKPRQAEAKPSRATSPESDSFNEPPWLHQRR